MSEECGWECVEDGDGVGVGEGRSMGWMGWDGKERKGMKAYKSKAMGQVPGGRYGRMEEWTEESCGRVCYK